MRGSQRGTLSAAALGAMVVGSCFANASLLEPLRQVLGSYANGKLRDATAFATEGEGFTHLFRSRDRGWGSEGLTQLVASAAREMATRFPDGERLQVGDLSARRGGQISGHASHQNGLDVDLAYFRKDHREQAIEDPRGFDESFVDPNGALTGNFDFERNWALVRFLVSTGRVNRIFVAPEIKAAICAYAGELPPPESIEALRRLRPYSNHDDHLHVRLTCPPTSPRCVTQVEVPPGSGCDDRDVRAATEEERRAEPGLF